MNTTRTSGDERTTRLAEQLWAAHGSPEGCYHEFYVQAVEEIAIVDAICASRPGAGRGRRPFDVLVRAPARTQRHRPRPVGQPGSMPRP